MLLGIVGFIIIYLLLAFGLSRITVNSEDKDKNEDVTIYIKTNGVHTDIVVPIKNEYKDWSEKVQFAHIKSQDSTMQYIGFGWGDKGFYLNTTEWSDFNFISCLFGAFYL